MVDEKNMKVIAYGELEDPDEAAKYLITELKELMQNTLNQVEVCLTSLAIKEFAELA